MILESIPTGPLDTNAYFFACLETKKGVAIDPALGSAPIFLEKAKKNQVTIEKILLTHSHWDHIADVSFLQEQLAIPIYVHKMDSENVLDPGSDHVPMIFPIEPATPDEFLEDGQEVVVGLITFRVIHTPGHSPGGVCFYSKGKEILFSGDTLFKGSFGNVSLPTSDIRLMKTSLQRLSQLPGSTKVYPGHGESTTIADEKWLHQLEELIF